MLLCDIRGKLPNPALAALLSSSAWYVGADSDPGLRAELLDGVAQLGVLLCGPFALPDSSLGRHHNPPAHVIWHLNVFCTNEWEISF